MIFFVIILLLACGLLGLIILVQNPKGGGLAGNVAGFSNQFMGVKQTTDVLGERNLDSGSSCCFPLFIFDCIYSKSDFQ